MSQIRFLAGWDGEDILQCQASPNKANIEYYYYRREIMYRHRKSLRISRVCPGVAWLDDGDHSFTPRKSSGRTEQQNWECAIEEMVSFVKELKS